MSIFINSVARALQKLAAGLLMRLNVVTGAAVVSDRL
jgi:hypothetical protein